MHTHCTLCDRYHVILCHASIFMDDILWIQSIDHYSPYSLRYIVLRWHYIVRFLSHTICWHLAHYNFPWRSVAHTIITPHDLLFIRSLYRTIFIPYDLLAYDHFLDDLLRIRSFVHTIIMPYGLYPIRSFGIRSISYDFLPYDLLRYDLLSGYPSITRQKIVRQKIVWKKIVGKWS